MNADKQAAIARWELAQRRVQEALAEELEARAAVMVLAFPTPKYGTNTVELGDGRQAKAKFNQTYKITGNAEALNMVLRQLPPAVRDSLVKFKPELSQTVYKQLEPAHKRLVNEIIEIKDARPQLEIVTPKVA